MSSPVQILDTRPSGLPVAGSSASAQDRLSLALVVFACLLQGLMGTTLALTNLPLCDEGFYGVPSHVLSVTGRLQNPVMESTGIPYLRGIEQNFYWMAPLGMVLQAGAFKVFGFGLLVQRGLSVFCGVGVVLFWFLAIRTLVGDRIAALAAVFLSADFCFLVLSSRGRVDVVSLFFAMAALAAYMHWRERNLMLALAVSNIACAASGMVHPNGGIVSLITLAAMTFYLDRKRLRWGHLPAVAVGYLVLGAAWGWYIAQSPDLFVAQFFGNVSQRFAGSTWTRLISGEAGRYLSAYVPDAHGVRLVRLVIPVSFLLAFVYCAVSRVARQRAGLLLLMFAAASVGLAVTEGSKSGWYLIHLTPLLAVFVAIFVDRLWRSGKFGWRLTAAAQVFIVLMGFGSLAYSASSRRLHLIYDPAVSFLNTRLGVHDVVFAPSEFTFGLDCRDCLRDDGFLGAYSGKRANYIVIDSEYERHLVELRALNPPASQELQRRLTEKYQEVFRNSSYRILQEVREADHVAVVR